MSLKSLGEKLEDVRPGDSGIFSRGISDEVYDWQDDPELAEELEIDEAEIDREIEDSILLYQTDEDKRRRMLTHRPQTRGDCEDGYRPCPYVSCKYHLFLDVKGETVTTNFHEDEGEELHELFRMRYTCALDVADKNGASLEEVAEAAGSITREGVRQFEKRVVAKLSPSAKRHLRIFYAP